MLTRTLGTGAQADNKGVRGKKKNKKTGRESERKREREDRSIIRGGEKADSKEMRGFGGLPPRAQYFGLHS